MDIQKALRKISLEGCELLGKGVHGAVYQIDSETIVKVYLDGSDFERISDEMNRAKNAFIAGVPTAISYDVVDCGDGHLGVVYEMMDGTLSKYLIDNPDKFDECARKYAELLKTLHQIDTDEEIFGNFKDGFLSLTEKLRADLGDERSNRLIEFINAVPHSQTLIHGDCHPNNIMVQNDELLLIDMADIGYGNPIFEWGAMHQCLLSIKEDKCKQTIGIELSDSIKLFDKVLRYYLNTDDEQKIKNFTDICVPFNLLRMVFLMASGLDNTDDVKAIAFSIADQFLFSNMDHYILMAKNLPISFI